MAELVELPEAPEVPLWKALTHRPPALAVGASIPAIEVRAARVHRDPAAYAAVCGFPPGPHVPVTWPAVACRGLQMAVMTSRAFPLPIPGIVHVRQGITWTRRIGVEEAWAASCRVEGHRVVRSGGEFDLHTKVEIGGEVVWTAVTTILSRAIPGDGEKRPRSQEVPLRPDRSTRWSLPADMGRRYAKVSGDWNPIHLHPWSARLFGFKRPIMHGWWLLARALAELDDLVPEAGRVEARFLSPVSLPGTVTFEAEGGKFEIRGKERCVSGELG